MANKENKCKDLPNINISKNVGIEFEEVFKIQKQLQEMYGTKFDENSTIKELASFWMINKHSIEDELCEMFDALGGIDDGIGNAGWKYWKKENSKAKEMKISDLSQGDIKELKYEIVDVFHFFLNFAISIGMTGNELLSMYINKAKENVNRQSNDY